MNNLSLIKSHRVCNIGDMTFQRARTQEQRDERRRAIASVARGMLDEMPVAQLSLNELSRRVGLARSNILRYYESREAILLEILDQRMDEWAASVGRALEADGADRAAGGEGEVSAVAALLAESLAARPVLCDLICAQAGVLEQGVSTGLIVEHKRAVTASVRRVARALAGRLPGLDDGAAYEALTILLLLTVGGWPVSRPSAALQAAYDSDPEIAAARIDFSEGLARFLCVILTGLLAERAAAERA